MHRSFNAAELRNPGADSNWVGGLVQLNAECRIRSADRHHAGFEYKVLPAFEASPIDGKYGDLKTCKDCGTENACLGLWDRQM